ncbi:acyltransferase family protein [Ligilactobacillus hayakitensis]|uniref:acyltransferase family protein n=1 Tax=Ligilactobacillus hayakitensis TaxID=396716 RepID=UPI00138B032A|nr:acyltransferase family protein [Ligilactobacillus hayakitensis]
MDIAKGIGMLLVIAGHTFTSNNLIEHIIYNIHMPLFFILAGCFIKRKKPMKKFIGDKFCRLIIPYIVTCLALIMFKVLKLLITNKNNEIIQSIKELILSTIYGSGLLTSPTLHIRLIGAIWFLLAMFWGLVIYNYIFDKKYKTIYAIAIFLSGYMISKVIWLPLSILPGMMSVLFIHIGNILKESIITSKPYKIQKAILIGIVFILGTYLTFSEPHMDMSSCYYSDLIINTFTSVSGTYMVVYISQIIEKFRYLSKLLSIYGVNSLLVLCVHNVEGLSFDIGHIFSTQSGIEILCIRIAITVIFVIIVTVFKKKKEIK